MIELRTPSLLIGRRRLLQVGSLGLAGVSLPKLLAADDRPAGPTPKADACILIFLNGGPSHLDMWDLKPTAPDGIRGEFQPISTTLPDVQLSEHLPRLATQIHRCTLLRSLHHGVSNAHALAVYTSLTGHDRGDAVIAIGSGSEDYPSVGCTMALLRPPGQSMVANVSLPYITKEGAGGPPQPGFFAGFLGNRYDPLFILSDPNKADFSVPELTPGADVTPPRLANRRGLLSSLATGLDGGPARTTTIAMTGLQLRALDLLTSPAAQRALRISEEPDGVRESYGRNIYGQSVLLARRMIEAGTRVACISWAPDANATWDTHESNFKKLKGELLPHFDAAVSSLIDDLHQRGMLERTIVAVLGDFGRTPKINPNNAGRDHWNFCYTVMMAGGGFMPGAVYGASDRIGAFPARDPQAPGDVIATIYHLLGIPADQWVHDQLGRPHRLVSRGDVLNAVLA